MDHHTLNLRAVLAIPFPRTPLTERRGIFMVRQIACFAPISDIVS